MSTTKQTYAELRAAAERAEVATTSDAQLLALQAQVAELTAQLAAAQQQPPAPPAEDDVPVYWFRNPKTGVLHKVPGGKKGEDTVKRLLREGHVMEGDPKVTKRAIFEAPTAKSDGLA